MAVNSFNAQNPPVTTKGDVFTFSTIPTRLGVGANNTVLTADSSTATGLKWAAAGGKVLQVVSSTYSTATSIASTSLTDTGLTATITPSSTSSKVLVIVSAQARLYSNTFELTTQARLLRGSTTLLDYPNSYITLQANTSGSRVINTHLASMNYLDSPNTTSAVTYKLQGATENTFNSAVIVFQYNSGPSTITLLEIGA